MARQVNTEQNPEKPQQPVARQAETPNAAAAAAARISSTSGCVWHAR